MTLRAAAAVLPLRGPRRREGDCPLCRGPDQDRKLALQPRPSRRHLQRLHRCQPDPAPLGHRLQHQAQRDRAAHLLCPHAGDALQRKSGAVERRLLATQCWRRCSIASSGVSYAEQPGFRNEFHAGLQQAFGKRVIVSGEYIWKYTHNAFDFSVLGNTPITFPIDWHNSKIPGYALHVEVPEFHNFSAYSVMSSVAARFFPPQVAGAGATVGQNGPAIPHRPRREVQPEFARPVHLLARQLSQMASGVDSTGDTIPGRWPVRRPAMG